MKKQEQLQRIEAVLGRHERREISDAPALAMIKEIVSPPISARLPQHHGARFSIQRGKNGPVITFVTVNSSVMDEPLYLTEPGLNLWRARDFAEDVRDFRELSDAPGTVPRVYTRG